MSIGSLIKEYREKRGLTQQELADKIGKSRIMVYHYEKGEKNVPDLVLKEISSILNIPEREVFDSDFPFQDKTVDDILKENIEILENKGYKVFFDKNNDVYVFQNSKEILKTNKETFNNFFKFKKIDDVLKKGFTVDTDFISFLSNNFFVVNFDNKSEITHFFYDLEDIELNKEQVYFLLFSALNAIDKELKDYANTLKEEERIKREQEEEEIRRNFANY